MIDPRKAIHGIDYNITAIRNVLNALYNETASLFDSLEDDTKNKATGDRLLEKLGTLELCIDLVDDLKENLKEVN
jgi:hypothetical protein